MRDRLEVVRVAAGRGMTEMIDGQPLRNWTLVSLVHNAMDESLPVRSADCSVAVLVGITTPDPTACVVDAIVRVDASM